MYVSLDATAYFNRTMGMRTAQHSTVQVKQADVNLVEMRSLKLGYGQVEIKVRRERQILEVWMLYFVTLRFSRSGCCV